MGKEEEEEEDMGWLYIVDLQQKSVCSCPDAVCGDPVAWVIGAMSVCHAMIVLITCAQLPSEYLFYSSGSSTSTATSTVSPVLSTTASRSTTPTTTASGYGWWLTSNSSQCGKGCPWENSPTSSKDTLSKCQYFCLSRTPSYFIMVYHPVTDYCTCFTSCSYSKPPSDYSDPDLRELYAYEYGPLAVPLALKSGPCTTRTATPSPTTTPSTTPTTTASSTQSLGEGMLWWQGIFWWTGVF